MFKKSTITLLLLILGSAAFAQEQQKMKFDEPDDIYWDNAFGSYGVDGTISDIIHINQDSVIVAGSFTFINGYHTPIVALWDGQSWSSIPEGNEQLSSGFVSKIEYSDEGILYILFSGGRFSNYDQSKAGYVFAYDLDAKEILNPYGFFGNDFYSIVDISLADDGTLYGLTAADTNEDLFVTEYSGTVLFLDETGWRDIYNVYNGSPVVPKLEATSDGVIVHSFDATSMYNSRSSISDPLLVYTNRDYNMSLEDFGIDSVFNEINDVEYIDNGILVAGEPNDFNCFDCAVSKFSFIDSIWTTTPFYSFGVFDPVDIDGTDENNYSLSFSTTGIEGLVNSISIYKDGELSETHIVESTKRSPFLPVKEIYHTENGTFFSANGYINQANSLVSDFGLLNGQATRVGESPSANGIEGVVNSILEFGNDIYVAGDFLTAGGDFQYDLAVWNNGNWSNVGKFDNELTNGVIHSLSTYDKYLIVAGDFSRITTEEGPFYSKNIALYDSSSKEWSSLDYYFNDPIYDIEKIENSIYVRTYNVEQDQSSILIYQNGVWSSFYGFNNFSIVTINDVKDMIVHENELYLVGDFILGYNTNQPQEAKLLRIESDQATAIKIPEYLKELKSVGGKFSKIDDQVLLSVENDFILNQDEIYESVPLFSVGKDTLSSFLPSPSKDAVQVIGSNDRLFAFNATESGAAKFNHIATWDGTSWRSLGSGVKGYRTSDEIEPGVRDAIITSDGKLAVGGNFFMAGNKPASNFTFWSGETAPSTPQTISFKNTPVIDYAESLTFVWSNASYSTAFEFELSEDPDFNSLVVGLTGISENEVEVRTEFRLGTPYYWRVRAVNPNGYSAWSEVATFEMAAPVSTEEFDSIQQFELLQNYPNPFNPSTNIQFSLPEAHNIKLEIFDVSGRKVATLFNGERLGAGSHTTTFRADNLSSGVYFYRLEAGTNIQIKKMLLIK